MAVAAVAAAVDHALLGALRDFERPGFIFVQRPEVVFFVEVGLTARCLVCLEFCIADGQQFPVFLRRDAGVLFLAGGAVPGESEYIHAVFYHSINDLGNIFDVRSRYSGHNHAADASVFDAGDFFEGAVKGTGLAEPVVGFPHSVQGKLILLTAAGFQPPAYLVIQMERIAHDGKGNVPLLQ